MRSPQHPLKPELVRLQNLVAGDILDRHIADNSREIADRAQFDLAPLPTLFGGLRLQLRRHHDSLVCIEPIVQGGFGFRHQTENRIHIKAG